MRKKLAVVLLLSTAALLPELIWLATGALHHHDHDDHGHEAEGTHHDAAGWAELAEILVHGHEHPEGLPDHEHDLLSSQPVRHEAPRDLQAQSGAFSEIPAAPQQPSLSGGFLASRPLRLAGASPPILHLLCVLLI